MTKIGKRTINIFLALILLVGTITVYSVPANAAGVENLPYGVYNISLEPFSFRNTNLTPVKTVTGGSNLRLVFSFTRCASLDQGIASTPIKITVEIRDANTGARIGGQFTDIVNPGNTTYSGTQYWYLGYTGRKIQIWFDASSVNGPTNGGYRALTINTLTSAVM